MALLALALWMSAAASAAAASPGSLLADAPALHVVRSFDVQAATASTPGGLSYEEQAVIFALQGVVNGKADPFPSLYVEAGNLELWPGEDGWWRSQLVHRRNGTLAFHDVTPPTLCGLLSDFAGRVTGRVAYSGDDGFSLPIALTVSGLERALPVSLAVAAKHECLAQLPLVRDLRPTVLPQLGERASAWEWAIRTLLPNCSSTVAFNLNHFRLPSVQPPLPLPPPNPNRPCGGRCDSTAVTLSDADFAVQQQAFVMDFASSSDSSKAFSYDQDAQWIDRVFAHMAPGFGAFGWHSSEFKWVNQTGVGGGSACASLSTGSLSFWSRLPCEDGGRVAPPLPQPDRGMKLNRSKYYITFVTNDGDTARIVGAGMGQAWPHTKRGSVPVAWSLDLMLAKQAPAWVEYFSRTAAPNDSFVAALQGNGYLMMNEVAPRQLQQYAATVGQLLKTHMTPPFLVDSYGFASLATLGNYSKFAAAAGGAPGAFLAEPLYTNPTATRYGPLHTAADGNVVLSDGKTPVLATSKQLFFFQGQVARAKCPSCALAAEIAAFARARPPPYFVHLWGGIEPGLLPIANDSPVELWNLLQATQEALGEDFEVIGAGELVRLSREAVAMGGGSGM